MRPVAIAILLLAACGEQAGSGGPLRPAPAGVLEALPLPPDVRVIVDGRMADSGWARARELVVPLRGEGPREVRLKAAYDDEQLYLLAVWPDGEASLNRFWRYVSLVRWERHTGEDAISFWWAPGSEADAFRTRGCALYCHDGRHVADDGPGGGATHADVWFWGAQTTAPVGQARDMWLRFGANQRLRGDAQPEGSDMQPNLSLEFEGPGFVPAYIRSDARRILKPDNMQPLTLEHLTSKLAVEKNIGWEVPLDVLRPMRGSRGDVTARSRHLGKAWVVELSRRLRTGHRDDEPLPDPPASAWFAVAVHDGTDGAAHTVSEPIELRLLPIR